MTLYSDMKSPSQPLGKTVVTAEINFMFLLTPVEKN
jgi:hypothetical protein